MPPSPPAAMPAPPAPAAAPPSAVLSSAPPPRSGRFPLPYLLGGMLAAIVAAGAVGVVLAGSGKPAQNDGPTLPSPIATGTQRPTPTAGPVDPSPSTGTDQPTPLPTAGPAEPTPTPDSGGGTRYESETFVVTLPAGFRPGTSQTARQSIFYSDAGTFFIGSAQTDVAKSPQERIASEIAGIRKLDPNARVCQEPRPYPLRNGPANAWSVLMCVNLTSQSGQLLPRFWFTNIGTSTSDTAFFRLGAIASQENLTAFLGTVDQEILPTVQYKLLPPHETAGN